MTMAVQTIPTALPLKITFNAFLRLSRRMNLFRTQLMVPKIGSPCAPTAAFKTQVRSVSWKALVAALLNMGFTSINRVT